MIEAEVGEDVFFPGDNSRKLALFELWLYGDVSVINSRLAPSIIARSEAELLGISSPRFAIRVYLRQGSFVNIRRRKVTARQIRRTYDGDLADHLQGLDEFERLRIKAKKLSGSETPAGPQSLENDAHRKVNWIADSLLVPPKRLRDERYKFLTCSLAADYGETAMECATPFVTHISIGGGLCAQAACFMAMCLLNHSDIYGISEITLLASDDESSDEVEIHGLKPKTMVKFFDKVGLAAQLQEGVAHESLITEDEIRREIEKIRAALRIYVDNKIPILPMLSASRMQGLRPGEVKPTIAKPIIVSSGNQYVAGSSDIPLGKLLDYESSKIVDKKDLAHDNHCVVIVGRNEDASSFLLNDPATFPFMKCTPAQLFDARAYRSFAKDKDIPSRRYDITEVTATDLGRFQFITAAPKGANLWLLNLAGDADPQRGGLLGAIQKSLNSPSVPMGIMYDNLVSQVQNLDLHLGQWSKAEGMRFRSGFEIAADLAIEFENAGLIESRWYWVSYINKPDRTGEYVESFSMWDASHKWLPGVKLKDFLYLVIARKIDGSLHTTFKGIHVA